MDSLQESGAARHAPATLRNREAIAAIVRDIFKVQCDVLEIASGSGEHGLYFSALEPGWRWRPSDLEPDALRSINAWRKTAATQMMAPLRLDVCDPRWHETAEDTASYDGVFCANMIHIAPPAATLGLIKTVAAQLKVGGDLVLYGPFKIDKHHTAPSNAAFDESLKSRNPAWGIRDLGEVVEQARQHQLVHQKTHAMPANNLCLHFKRTRRAPHALA